MQEESALIGCDSGAKVQPGLQQRQRTGPGKGVGGDSPEERGNVQSDKERSPAGDKCAEHSPKDEEYVERKHESCKYGVQSCDPRIQIRDVRVTRWPCSTVTKPFEGRQRPRAWGLTAKGPYDGSAVQDDITRDTTRQGTDIRPACVSSRQGCGRALRAWVARRQRR